MTLKFAVFGNPIEHSLSPVIHQFFAQSLKLDISYEKILVTSTFKEALTEFLAHGGKGCNITVPCKLEAFALANTKSARASFAKACNTLKKLDDGSLYGDNTDGAGLILDLKSLQVEFKNKRFLVIGAGGAVRGILNEIYKEHVQNITVINRTYAKVKALKQDFPFIEIAENLSSDCEFDVIVNASSSSLYHVLPNLSDEVLKKARYVYDLMYDAHEDTIFIKHAKQLGVKHCADGLGMLICQAALAFELWTDKLPDINEAKLFLRNYLKAKS